MDATDDATIADSVLQLRSSLDQAFTNAHEHLFQDIIIFPKRRKHSHSNNFEKMEQQTATTTADTTTATVTSKRRKEHRRGRVVVPLPTTDDAQGRFMAVCGGDKGVGAEEGMAILLDRVEKENMMLMQSLAILERESAAQQTHHQQQSDNSRSRSEHDKGIHSPPNHDPQYTNHNPPDAHHVSATFYTLAGMRSVSDTLLPGVGLSIDEKSGLLVSTMGGISTNVPAIDDESNVVENRMSAPSGGTTIATSNKGIQTFPEHQVPLDGATCPHAPAIDPSYIVRTMPDIGNSGCSTPTSTRSCIIHRSHALDERGRPCATTTTPSTYPPKLDHGPLASSTQNDDELLSDFRHKLERNVMAVGAKMSLRPSTTASPLYEALPSTPRSHLHPPLSTTIDPSLQAALHKSNAFRSYLANSVGSVVPMSAIAAFEPTSLRDMATAIFSQPNMGYDPLRMIASVSHMYEGSLTLGMLLVTDSSIMLLREGSEIPANRKTLILLKSSFRKLQIGATLSGDKAAPSLSNAIPPPALHFYLSPSIPPSALQQQFYRTVIIQCTLPHKNKAGYYADSVQTIVFESDSEIMKFLSLMDLDANGARASPFSPFYCPTVQLQKHFGDYGWRKRWGGVGFGEHSWLSEGSNSMAGLASVGGAAATAIATSGSKAALVAGLTLDASTASRQVTSIASRSMVPLPIRQHCFSKTATLSPQNNFPVTMPLLPVEVQLCSAHHIHPRALAELKTTLLFDPSFGTWFTAMDIAAYLPPVNGKHFNIHQARIILEFWMYYTKQIEAVEVIEVVPHSM